MELSKFPLKASMLVLEHLLEPADISTLAAEPQTIPRSACNACVAVPPCPMPIWHNRRP